jgi:hypothetical protein
VWSGFTVPDYYRAKLAVPSFHILAVVALAALATLRSINRAATFLAWPSNLAHILDPTAEWYVFI